MRAIYRSPVVFKREALQCDVSTVKDGQDVQQCDVSTLKDGHICMYIYIYTYIYMCVCVYIYLLT